MNKQDLTEAGWGIRRQLAPVWTGSQVLVLCSLQVSSWRARTSLSWPPSANWRVGPPQQKLGVTTYQCLCFSGQFLKGQDVTKLASMCKLKAGRLAREVSDSCLQFWGGMGFTNEVTVSRLYRYVYPQSWTLSGPIYTGREAQTQEKGTCCCEYECSHWTSKELLANLRARVQCGLGLSFSHF